MNRLINKPSFKQGDIVYVIAENNMYLHKRIVTVCGLASENVIDMWIVDFGDNLSEDYPFRCAVYPGTLLEHIVKTEDQ